MDKYYDAAELAILLHKKRDTIRKMISRGEFGETLNDGKTHLVSEVGLKTYITQHTGPARYERAVDIHRPYRRAEIDCTARI